MKIFKFKSENLQAEAVLIAPSFDEAVKVLARNVAEDAEVRLIKEVEVTDIKKATLLLSNIPPF